MKSFLILTLSTLLGGSFLHASEPQIPAGYPLTTCPVSKELLGSGGMIPYKVTHNNTEVWLCCKMCKKKFDRTPDHYAKPVQEALKKQ